MRPAKHVWITLWLALTLPTAASAAELVASISNHLVAITTGFTGTNILLFGATDGPGDVLVVVRGPEIQEVVRRKSRRFGIWINDTGMVFGNVPGFYALAASSPVSEILPDAIASLYQIGFDNLRVTTEGQTSPPQVTRAFREALIRNKSNAGLYSDKPSEIRFLGNRLFRTDIWIPANAPLGSYTVSTFLVRESEVVSAEIVPLVVNKVGFEARVFEFAKRYSLAYGIAAVVLASLAGGAAYVLFHKD
jgi:uncharacterized protein (TIGR02186 family)